MTPQTGRPLSGAGGSTPAGRAEAGNNGQLSVKDAVQQTLDEARMVLPGIQALFGFQMIAVFNEGFERRLTTPDQVVHLVALGLVALAIGMVMTPAAYHRQSQPRSVDEAFLMMASRCVTAALAPLALGLSLDIYVVARLVLGRPDLAVLVGSMVLVVLVALWFVYPRWKNRPAESPP